MEVRSDPSFNVGVQKAPSSSLIPTVQNTPMADSDSPASQGLNANTIEKVKRKRGRPRKYAAPDWDMALGMLSTPQVAGSSSGFTISSVSAVAAPRLEVPMPAPGMQKMKDRPPSSKKKHQKDALGSSGIGFTPHVITVKAGEDVSEKIMSFSHHGPRAMCILSANGAISNVTLRQAATSCETVTYEGRFEILSLSGSFLLSESSGQRSRTGGLSVSLAGPDGHVLGGGVAGLLIAATPVQIIVGSFIADRCHKEPQLMSPLVFESAPEKLTRGGMPRPTSPISRGTMSESLGGGGPGGSPHNQSSNGNDQHGNINQPVMPWK